MADNRRKTPRRLHNVEITLGSESLPEPLEIEGLGTECVYSKAEGTERRGGFSVWRPTDFTLRFRLTDADSVRKLCGKLETMIKPYTMVVRWLDDNGKPVCTVNLIGMKFLKFTQIKPAQDDPYEQVECSAESLTYGEQPAAASAPAAA